MEINVDEKNITIQTNEGVQKIKNILTDTLVQDTIINYPKRKNKPIQLFDYKNVTNHQKFKKFENKLEEYSNNNSDPFKIDDLLKRLDGKIKELEKEEIKEMKLLAEKDTSLKSDLLQFKLHDNDD